MVIRIACDSRIDLPDPTSIGKRNPHPVEVRKIDFADIDDRALKNTEILVVGSSTRVGEAMLSHSSVRLVASATSGTDHIDKSWLERNHIEYLDAKGGNALAVAEYVLKCILLWSQKRPFGLSDARVAIVGFGCVGTTLYHLLKALDISVLVCDPFLASERISPATRARYPHPNDDRWVDFDRAIGADIVSVHVPLSTDGPHPTYRLLDADTMSQFADHACVINTSRGGVQIDDDLLQWAQSHPRQLCLDVYQREPEPDPRFFEYCLTATPHIAGYTVESKKRIAAIVRRKLDSWWDDRRDHSRSDSPEFEGATIDLRSSPKWENRRRMIQTLLEYANPIDDTERWRSAWLDAGAEPSARREAFMRFRRSYLRTPPIRREYYR